MPNFAHLDVLEAVGVGPRSELAVRAPRLLGNDAHSLSSQAKPTSLDISGVPVFTFERWLRLRFSPPFGQVSKFRFWVTEMDLPDDWTLNFGTSPDYSTPVQTSSRYAYRAVPTIDPGQDASNVEVVQVVPRGVQYTHWIVLQAILLSAPTDITVTFDFTWTES